MVDTVVEQSNQRMFKEAAAKCLSLEQFANVGLQFAIPKQYPFSN